MEKISLRGFAELVDVSDTSIRKAIKAGRITEKSVTSNEKNGRPMLFKQMALKDWKDSGSGLIKEIVNSGPKDKVQPLGGDPALITTAEAKRQTAIYESKLKGLDLAERQKILVPRQKVFEELFAFGTEIKNSLLRIPDKYLDLIFSAKDRTEANEILQAAIYETLESLANFEKLKI